MRHYQPLLTTLTTIVRNNKSNVTCFYLALDEYYTPQRGPVVIVACGPAPLLQQLGLDTERISVPFFLKGVNHMAYLAHVVTAVWWVLLFV